MKIAFVGYGKMGHMLESTAIALGHESAVTVDVFAKDAKVIVPEGDADAIARAVKESGAEGIIEFTHPSAVMTNIKALHLWLELQVGTTRLTKLQPLPQSAVEVSCIQQIFP